MYSFVSHTWNTVKGECSHGCSYCYMNNFGQRKSVRFDQYELKTNLGRGNYIFVGSSNDLFAKGIPSEWIQMTIDHCNKFDNKYLFQSKNPERINEFKLPANSIVCTTIETNRVFPEIMNNCPYPEDRAKAMETLSSSVPTFVTIEPIMDFDLEELVKLIRKCNPVQVNIGSDSGGNNLPEPDKSKITELIVELNRFTKIDQKRNLGRIMR